MFFAIVIMIPVAPRGLHVEPSRCTHNRVFKCPKCRSWFGGRGFAVWSMEGRSSPFGSFMQRGFEIYIARLHPEIEQAARMLFGICKVAPQASFLASNADFE